MTDKYIEQAVELIKADDMNGMKFCIAFGRLVKSVLDDNIVKRIYAAGLHITDGLYKEGYNIDRKFVEVSYKLVMSFKEGTLQGLIDTGCTRDR